MTFSNFWSFLREFQGFVSLHVLSYFKIMGSCALRHIGLIIAMSMIDLTVARELKLVNLQ